MKRSYLPILIVSALIFIAAKSASPLEQSRNQGHATESDKHENSTNDQPAASPAFYAAILGELRTLVSEEVAKQEQEHADREDWSTKPFWITVVLNGLLVVAGLAYTVVAYRQLDTINRQTDILKIGMRVQRLAAIAADKGAEAAELALNAERPYIFVEKQQIETFLRVPMPDSPILASLGFRPDPPESTPSAVDIRIPFELRNRGKGIALIQGISLTLVIRNVLDREMIKLKTQRLRVITQIVGSQEGTDYRATGFTLPRELFDRVADDSAAILFVVGVVRYRDVFKRQFWTRFCFHYLRPRVGPNGELLSAPKLGIANEKYNRYT